MSGDPDDPRCPECGGKIGQTATYCMHCSADLTDERAAADADGDGVWDETDDSAIGYGESSGEPSAGNQGPGGAASTSGQHGDASQPGSASQPTDSGPQRRGRSGDHGGRPAGGRTGGGSDQLLDPDGLVDNTLTVVVGIFGGIVVGLVGTTVLTILTRSGWAFLFGLVVWLGSTAYLVRRPTVQGAVSKSAYGVALVLLSVPLLAFVAGGGIETQGGIFLVLLIFVAIPAGIAAVVGFVASRFVPEDDRVSLR